MIPAAVPLDATAAVGRATARETLLAFDFGLQRIGVAVGNGETRLAQALTTIAAEDNARRFGAIAALIEEWRPARLVVGLPLHPDGTTHDMTRRCRRFAHQLEGRFALPVSFADERYTSAEAEVSLRGTALDPRQRRERIDAVAAQAILQSYFDDADSRR